MGVRVGKCGVYWTWCGVKKELPLLKRSPEVKSKPNCESFDHNTLIRILFADVCQSRCPFMNTLCAVEPLRHSRQL